MCNFLIRLRWLSFGAKLYNVLINVLLKVQIIYLLKGFDIENFINICFSILILAENLGKVRQLQSCCCCCWRTLIQINNLINDGNQFFQTEFSVRIAIFVLIIIRIHIIVNIIIINENVLVVASGTNEPATLLTVESISRKLVCL